MPEPSENHADPSQANTSAGHYRFGTVTGDNPATLLSQAKTELGTLTNRLTINATYIGRLFDRYRTEEILFGVQEANHDVEGYKRSLKELESGSYQSYENWAEVWGEE